MIGLALSGGGSRAMAFHLGCLRTLNDFGLLDKISVMSSVSGGSVIGALYAYSPDLSFEEFDSKVVEHLKRGFQKSILGELLTPQNLFPVAINTAATKIQAALAKCGWSEQGIHRDYSRTDVFAEILNRDVLGGVKLSSPRRNEIETIIGACDLKTGTAFRFGNETSGCGQLGQLLENDISVGFAVAASAAFPLLLPPLDRTWRFSKNGEETEHRVNLTDGGVYDNSGFQVLEPGRDPKYSLHSFPCEYIIACNAGQGQDSGAGLPLGFLPRISKSFGVVHRRVQDMVIHHLHHLQESGDIRGFVLPYLGQQDGALPWKPNDLVTREEVFAYPTDFSAMTDEWITKLSGRGESLTRILVPTFLKELLG